MLRPRLNHMARPTGAETKMRAGAAVGPRGASSRGGRGPTQEEVVGLVEAAVRRAVAKTFATLTMEFHSQRLRTRQLTHALGAWQMQAVVWRESFRFMLAAALLMWCP